MKMAMLGLSPQIRSLQRGKGAGAGGPSPTARARVRLLYIIECFH